MSTPEPTIQITMSQRPDGHLAMVPVGIKPYILITIPDVTDNSISVGVEVGGGVQAEPLDELASFIALLAEALDHYEVAADDDEDSSSDEE